MWLFDTSSKATEYDKLKTETLAGLLFTTRYLYLLAMQHLANTNALALSYD